MRVFARRSVRFWVGAAFLGGGATVLAAPLVAGGAPGAKAVAMAAFLAALAARFLSYELQDPGFSRSRTLLVAVILAAILLLGLRLPGHVAAPVYFIGSALVLAGAAGDVWDFWRSRRLAA
ncbi:MAG TPA: hypothetical protein VHV27_01375 [Phenylobacterium sp.]|jgi:hypothetical protein|nr:hypothetical protein [Phenylobacterium sp.]